MNDHVEWEHELTATRMAIQALREKRERTAARNIDG